MTHGLTASPGGRRRRARPDRPAARPARRGCVARVRRRGRRAALAASPPRYDTPAPRPGGRGDRGLQRGRRPARGAGDAAREVCGLATRRGGRRRRQRDGTAEAAAARAAPGSRVPVNRGQGAALRLGYRVAREHGAAYVLTTDADGQYDVATCPRCCADPRGPGRLRHRLARLGQQTRDGVRRPGVHVFAWTVGALAGRRLTDTSFGLRAMRAEVTAAVTLNQPQYQSSELLIGALSHGFRVLEVPGDDARPGGRARPRRAATSSTAALRPGRARHLVARGLPRPGGRARPRPGGSPRGPHGLLTTAVPRRSCGLGAVLRVVVQGASRPASSSATAPLPRPRRRPRALADRTVGYGMLLWPVLGHPRGLAGHRAPAPARPAHRGAAYAVLRRWGVSRGGHPGDCAGAVRRDAARAGALGAQRRALRPPPAGRLAVLAWHRAPRGRAGAGRAAARPRRLVRVVGQPMVLAAVVFCVRAAATWRARLVAAVASPRRSGAGGRVRRVVPPRARRLGAHGVRRARPLHADDGVRRLRSFTVPDYERPLCPAEPLGQRLDPTSTAGTPRRAHGLTPPAGMTPTGDARLRGRRSGPSRGTTRGSWWDVRWLLAPRNDRFEYDTADKWRSSATSTRADRLDPPGLRRPRRRPADRRQPARLLAAYGPGLHVGAGAAPADRAGPGLLFAPGRSRGARRCVIFPLAGVRLGCVAPDVTAQFVWRYQLPAFLLLPVAAVLAWTRLRAPRRAGERASPARGEETEKIEEASSASRRVATRRCGAVFSITQVV